MVSELGLPYPKCPRHGFGNRFAVSQVVWGTYGSVEGLGKFLWNDSRTSPRGGNEVLRCNTDVIIGIAKSTFFENSQNQ